MPSSFDTETLVWARFQALQAQRQQQLQAQCGERPGIAASDAQGQLSIRALSAHDIQEVAAGRVNIEDLLPQREA